MEVANATIPVSSWPPTGSVNPEAFVWALLELEAHGL